MTIAAGDDRPHLPDAPDASFRDAVTFSFGDQAAKLYGLARLSLGPDGANGLAVLYAGDEPVAARTGASANADGSAAGTWDGVEAAGVRVAVEQPLQAWSVRFEQPSGGFDLRFEACSTPAELAGDGAVASAGGMHGYDQLCRVTGTATHGGRTHPVRCLGQRGQLWGSPDSSRIELTRTVSAWLGEDRALTLTAVRPAKSKGHLDEALSAFMFEDGAAVPIADPRLSTTYDGEQHQRRAGLELWMDEDGDVARRIAGEVLCGSSLDLGDQRLESSFFAWRMEGRTGVGRYDVLRRAGDNGRKRRR